MLLLIFSVLFLYYPVSYGLNIKVTICFVVLVAILFYLLKKMDIKINLSSKYHLFIIVLFAILTRVGIVTLFNDKVTQVSDFGMALDAAKTGWFQTDYYQVFTHWIMYPKILSQIFKLFGTSQFVALLFNSGILILASILLYKVAGLILKNEKKAFYVSLIYIFWPSNILYTLITTPEHICSFLLLLILYLFLKINQNRFYSKKPVILIISSILVGILLSICSFFKNFSFVCIVAFIIYLIMDFLFQYSKTKNIKINEVLSKFNFKNKALFVVFIIISFFVTNSFIYNKIEKDFVRNPVVRNVAPCYLNVGLRNNGIYDSENAQMYSMYFDTFKNHDYDYRSANKEIMSNLKHYLLYERSKADTVKMLDYDAEILNSNDASKINYVVESLQNSKDYYIVDFIKDYVIKVNNIFYLIIIFLSAIGLIKMYKEKNLKLFLSYLIVYGSLLLILIIETQNRYMYAIQSLMCINAVAGFSILKKLFVKYIKPEKIMKQKVDYRSIFYLGFFILLFIFLNIFIPSLMLLINVSVQKCYFYISLILTIGIVLYLLKRWKILNIKSFLVSIVLPIFLIVTSITVSGQIYDSTWDGNMYHKASIGYLMDGWNPNKEPVEEYDMKQERPKMVHELSHLWINHYPKASYLFGADIGVVTGRVESGKAINFLSMVVLFTFTLSLLLFKKKKRIFAILFSFLILSCTTILSQIINNFVDCLVFLYFYMLIWYFFANEEKGYISKAELLACYLIFLVVLINIKYSSFGYAGIFCLGYYLWYFIRLLQKKFGKEQFIGFTLTSVSAVIISIFVVGSSSYPKNYVEHGNPFYPLMGEGKIDIMNRELIPELHDAPPIKRFLVSTYSEALNASANSNEKAMLKIPFIIKEKELPLARRCEIRISGNGFLFSGILTVSFFVFMILIIKEFKRDRKKFMLMIIPIFITVIMMFVMSDLWWLRYFPQIHFFVLGAILLMEQYSNLVLKYLQKFLMIMTFLNGAIFLYGGIDEAFRHSTTFNRELDIIRGNYDPHEYQLKIYTSMFPGAYFDIDRELPEYQIIYTDIPIKDYEYTLNGGYECGIAEKL